MYDVSDPILTEEELAACEALTVQSQPKPCACVLADSPKDCKVDPECISHSGSAVRMRFLEEQHRQFCLAIRSIPRLIAALRSKDQQIAELRQEVESTKAVLRAKNPIIYDLERQVVNLKASLNSRNAEVQALKTELEDAKEVIGNLVYELSLK